MKSKAPGELFQIDHASLFLASNYPVKHFQGVCPFTKIFIAQAYSSASSLVAWQFLEHVISSLPFKLSSIQVDGGSEFMKDFELACKEMGIDLYVLPPRSPEYNGTVERANGSAKSEFYPFYEGALKIHAIQKGLQRYVTKYNNYRPHQALQYLTPQQYYSQISGA